VGSNVTWTLSTKDNDANGAANHGFMVDPVQAPVAKLANSLHVVSATTNVDLAGSATAFPIYASMNNAAVPLTFSQAVAPQDKPGSYGMSVLFSITSTF
jgi:hypothetical protein